MKKTIAIFGASGFIGSHLIRRLSKDGFKLIILSKDPVSGMDDFTIKQGDIRDKVFVSEAIKDADEVINLAGVINKSADVNIKEDWDVNCQGLLNILEALKGSKKRLLFFSSSLVYGSGSGIKFSEDDAKSPKTVYGIHKLLCELYCSWFFDVFGVRSIILRPSGIYGPLIDGIKNRSAVNLFIEKALSNEELVIFGDGSDKKDWLFVDDLADIVSLCLKSDVDYGIFNVSGECLSVNEIVELIGKNFKGLRVIKKSFTSDQLKFDSRSLICSSNRAFNVFGWKYSTSFKKGIKLTIDSYREVS